jgi:hypothetical protein
MKLTSNFINPGRSLFAFAAATLISSCSDGGGGLGAVITPIDGQWLSESGLSIDFDESFTNTRFFNRSYEIIATLDNSADPCGLDTSVGESIQFETVYDEGTVNFYVGDPQDDVLCLKGVFTDLVTLQVDTVHGDSFDVFNNSRVGVRLDLGMWVSSDRRVEMIFFEPSTVDNDNTRGVTGCVRFNGTIVDGVTGTLAGFNTVVRQNPTTGPLLSESTGEPVFSSITFVDVFTLSSIQPDGTELTLERVDEQQQTFCDDFF